jgi:alanine dehydrogenase
MTTKINPPSDVNPAGHYVTQEKRVNPASGRQQLRIGIPRERLYDERRVPLVPESVGLLVQEGHVVLIEKDAGLAAGFSDLAYAEAGGEVTSKTAEVFGCDIVLKVTPPTQDEIDWMGSRRLVISALNYCGRDRHFFTALMKKKATAISYEAIRDKAGRFAVMQSISEIVGVGSILTASSLLADPNYGKGTILGGFPGITPTEVVIIGAGTVALAAARMATLLGAVVKVFDNRVYKLRTITNKLGPAVFTSIIQPKVLQKAIHNADVVIGALVARGDRMPYVVPEVMVKGMKMGAIIIDVSIDQGGVFETSRQTTHKAPIHVAHGISHYCVPNIASGYARTSSYALSNHFTPLLSQLGEYTSVNQFILDRPGLLDAIYMYQGILTHNAASRRFNIPGQDINLLLAAF